MLIYLVHHILNGFLLQQSKEEGQGLVEYALILIFVAVVAALLLTILGPGIQNIYQNIIDAMESTN